MRSSLWVVLGTVLFCAPVGAQAATDDTILDEVLSGRAVTWAQAAWLVGRSSGSFDETVTPAQAASQAVTLGWSDRPVEAETPVDLGLFSFLLVRAHGLPTGLLFSWYPGGRYAYRELAFRKIVPPGQSTTARVSGSDALQYVQNAAAWSEAHR